MPGFDGEVWVEDGVHLDEYVGGDEGDGGEVEDPGVEVEGSGEEAKYAGTGNYRGPVIDCKKIGHERSIPLKTSERTSTSRRDCTCELRYGGSDRATKWW